MSDQPQDKSATRPDRAARSDRATTAESPLVDVGRVAVTYGVRPPKGPPDKEIHPRRKLPEVPSRSFRGRADELGSAMCPMIIRFCTMAAAHGLMA